MIRHSAVRANNQGRYQGVNFLLNQSLDYNHKLAMGCSHFLDASAYLSLAEQYQQT